jgi:hypothetical protein
MINASEAIKSAEERLADAKFGLADMQIPARARSGFRNAVVFGRMVTFMLQNMRGHVPGFDPWYNEIVASLKADPMMKYFSDLRTEIEKTIKPHLGAAFSINKFDTTQLQQIPKPRGAKSFFMGDSNGGSGWLVELPDGSEEKYYIDLPGDWDVKAQLTLPGAPDSFNQDNAIDLVREYPERLGEIVADAKIRFVDAVPPKA